MTRAIVAALFLALIVLSFMAGRAASRSSVADIPAASFVPVGQSAVGEPEPRRTSGTPMAHGRPTPEPAGSSPSSGLRGSLTGMASWYFDGAGLYAAAGPALRVGNWRGRLVRVCAGSRCIAVRLSDWCGCYGTRLIDLSRDAFASLAPLSRGLLEVSVRW